MSNISRIISIFEKNYLIYILAQYFKTPFSNIRNTRNGYFIKVTFFKYITYVSITLNNIICLRADQFNICFIPAPINCQHIKENGTKEDGEYDLYLNWPRDKRATRIYCSDMNSQNPTEYITLPAGKTKNFARVYKHQTGEKEETQFEKVFYKPSKMLCFMNRPIQH